MTARLALLIGVLLSVAFASSAVSAEAKTRPLRVLVSNDDGVKGPGLDALVRGLRRIPQVTVAVSAPAANNSGAGGRTSPGPLRAKRSTTRSGYPAVAVEGYPADAVDYALRTAARRSQIDLVITGINPGVNPGFILNSSGTVGAARAAAQKGLPALAVSIGRLTQTKFADAVTEMTAWVKADRDRLKRGTVMNLNVPGCSSGRPRGIIRSVSALHIPPGVDPWTEVDCTQKAPAVRGEFTNLRHGFATVTKIPLRPAEG